MSLVFKQFEFHLSLTRLEPSADNVFELSNDDDKVCLIVDFLDTPPFFKKYHSLPLP
jgi:hypothetical protein